MKGSAFVALGFAGALALVAAPAAAQHHRSGGEDRHDNAAPRAESRRDGGSAPQAQSQPAPRQDQRAAPQQDQRTAPRQDQRAVPRQDQRAVPRQEFHSAPQTYAPRYAPGYAAPRYYSGRYYGPRYVGPAYAIAPRRFFRPYYVFHPHLSIGFGIWAGYPIAYYDPYYYPYDYYPYATAAPGYPPPPSGSVSVQPNQPEQSNMGGLSFEITPNTAEVYVDGNYAGTVGQFTANSQPLGLPAGHHHVELREPGFNVSSFDVDIVAGQVIPFSGALER